MVFVYNIQIKVSLPGGFLFIGAFSSQITFLLVSFANTVGNMQRKPGVQNEILIKKLRIFVGNCCAG